MTQKEIFFSYSRKDSEFALKLAEDLISNNFKVWIDQLSIPVGERWDKSVGDALQRCDCFIIVLSPTSVISENVLDEVNFGINRGKKIVPVIVKDCEVPFRLERLQYIDFTKHYFEGFQRLLQELDITKGSPSQKKFPSSIKKIVVIAAIFFIIIITGLLIMLTNNERFFDLTIKVTPADSQIAGKITGYIKVRLDSTIRTLPIDSHNKVIFNKINSKYLGTSIIIGSDIPGFEISSKNEIFLVIPDVPSPLIKLTLNKKIDSVLFEGLVYIKNQRKLPLLVKYATLIFSDFDKRTMTDSLGRFRISLPSTNGYNTNFTIFQNGKLLKWGKVILSKNMQITTDE